MSPGGLELKRRKKLSVEDQLLLREDQNKQHENDVEDGEEDGEEDDGEDDEEEDGALLTVPSTHPETLPERKGPSSTLVFSCAQWCTHVKPIYATVYTLSTMYTTLKPPQPTCHPGKAQGTERDAASDLPKGTTCTVACYTTMPPPAVLLKFASCFFIAMSRYKFYILPCFSAVYS